MSAYMGGLATQARKPLAVAGRSLGCDSGGCASDATRVLFARIVGSRFDVRPTCGACLVPMARAMHDAGAAVAVANYWRPVAVVTEPSGERVARVRTMRPRWAGDLSGLISVSLGDSLADEPAWVWHLTTPELGGLS